MEKTLKRLLIIEQPINNRGDESAHKALVRSILKSLPNVRIQVLFVCENEKNIKPFDVNDCRVEYINIDALKIRSSVLNWLFVFLLMSSVFVKNNPKVKSIIPIFMSADFILCAPGGINMGGFQSWRHIILLFLAKCLKKPVFYYGRSIGPFPTLTVKNRVFKKKSLELLHYFSFLSLRDKKSMDLAESLNVQYVPTVDSAFLETPNVEIPQSVSNLIGINPYIVFVPNKLIWHYAYRGKVSINGVMSFYKKILDVLTTKYPMHNIVMLPQTYNFDDCNRGDINFFRDLKKFTQNQKMIIIPDIYSSDVQQMIISKADCMVGARYHSIVFAINQAIPFVALSYEHKICGLLETLHKTESIVDITASFDSEENMKMTMDLFSKALYAAKKDVNARILAKQIANECFVKFVKKIDE